ncbi:OST-HTH/LOTUS domain-containing protein, partial [Nostoc sp. 'Peltigera malacea cyanobiont' DB3992]|uniref:OST-HTH/LOTUS domain-containing protein n=1 Tax=Nostoc sp. 'Peltigera malacea cyanobiont' DB3992 TaxID=1206980 RepID=UPI000C063777
PQYQETVYFYKSIKLFVFSVVIFLRENYAESNPKTELLYQQLKAEIISSGVEYINLNNPSETAWENTKIVKLLRLAETNTDKTADMTSLARAGKFIKNQDPKCTPKKYGINTLKGVLKASGLFEITESQDTRKNSTFILYKSKIT